MEFARYLSETIGPRYAGSAKEFEAACCIREWFEQMGYPVYMQDFSFLNWRPLSRPTLQIYEPERREIILAPMGYTLPTPSGGIEGLIRKTGKMILIPKLKEWDRYAIVSNGVEQAFLVKNPAAGEASPFPSGRPLLPEIGAIMSRDDAERLDRWLDAEQTVRARLFTECQWTPAISRNVIARCGDGAPELVVCAHYDSAYLAPGAVDNASGIQALLDTARTWRNDGNSHIVWFVAMGCEEQGLLGAYAFVHGLQEHNMINSVRACVNFDMIAHGKEIVLRTGCHMEEPLQKLISDFQNIVRSPIIAVPATSTSDNWPFHEAGIPNMQFLAQPFPVYHLPSDTMQQYDPALVEDVEKLALPLIRQLLK